MSTSEHEAWFSSLLLKKNALTTYLHIYILHATCLLFSLHVMLKNRRSGRNEKPIEKIRARQAPFARSYMNSTTWR